MAKINKPQSRRSLAENLRAARSLLGWSQEQLGFETGLKRTYIGALERGEINPGIDNVDKLATGLGVDPCTLLTTPAQAYEALYQEAARRAKG